nr:glycoside hydrolase family 43 protein [Vallitaleaceae bacterium]
MNNENMIQNPILKGFNSDPSIIRVGDDYYIATSTFEWYPGVQIHHSRDLQNWQLVARPLKRSSQLNMLGEKNSCGVWAPCLSYDNGTYYLVYTDVKNSGTTHNYLVTSDNILGEWSDPIYLDSRGFDPSLFHDEDGKKWYSVMYLDQLAWNAMLSSNTANINSPTAIRIWEQYKEYDKGTPLFKGILMQEYSLDEKKLIGKPKHIFGNEIGITEGSHQYKRGDYYYLLLAEGGTSYEHAVTFARSKNIEGPYVVHPQNPLICSQGTDAYLQKTGHADLVETKDGETYMVHLCSRPLD